MAVIVLLKMKAEIKALFQSNTSRQTYICYAMVQTCLELKKMQTKRKHNSDCHPNRKGGNYKNIIENAEAIENIVQKNHGKTLCFCFWRPD